MHLLRGFFELCLGAKTLGLQELRPDVRRHDDDGVLEIDHAAFAVGQAAVVHHLQQDVEYIRMRLFDLIEEHDRVRTATNLLGQLSAFFVADISRRRADQACDGMLLHVLGHVDAQQRVLVVEQEFGERTGEFGLADTRRSEENEGTDRPLRIAKPGTRTANCIGHPLERRILADDALAQALFHRDQLLHFAFEHLGDGNAGPLGDDARDVFFVDFFLEHALFTRTLHLAW